MYTKAYMDGIIPVCKCWRVNSTLQLYFISECDFVNVVSKADDGYVLPLLSLLLGNSNFSGETDEGVPAPCNTSLFPFVPLTEKLFSYE